MILACDIGGTKTNLALLEEKQGVLEFVRFATYPSRDHDSLDGIIEHFLSGGASRLQAAGFGVAGPVVGGQVHTTNLPWLIDGRSLARRLGLASVVLLNDVEAHAWAVERLAAVDLAPLQEGSGTRGNAAVIAAGTGLGFSALIRGPAGAMALASEGGHADFAPAEEIEMELLRHLQARFGHVSVERVLSGPGLLSLYSFLRDREGGDEPVMYQCLCQGQGRGYSNRGRANHLKEVPPCSRSLRCAV